MLLTFLDCTVRREEFSSMGELKVYSLEEVKKHSKGGKEPDVWLVIHDKVYDVTKFLDNVSSDPLLIDAIQRK